jgi:hypothetical protein
MGIRFYCPNGHKLNVKVFQAGRKGICPYCGSKFVIPTQSTRKSSREARAQLRAKTAAPPIVNAPSPDVAAAGVCDLPEPVLGTPDAMAPVVPEIIRPVADLPAAEAGISSSPNDLSALLSGKAEPDAPILRSRKKWGGRQSQASPEGGRGAAHARSAPDPFTAAGNVVWYVRPLAGGQYGPATTNVMRQWLAEGRICADTLVWREGWRDWQPGGEVFPELRNRDAADAGSDAAGREPIASLIRQEIGRQTPQNMLRLIVIFIVLTVIIIAGLCIWAFFPR